MTIPDAIHKRDKLDDAGKLIQAEKRRGAE